MTLGLDPLFFGTLYFFLLCPLWVFAMDIQTASRALWHACGNLKDKMRHSNLPRPQSDPSLAYSDLRDDESRPSTPERRDSWSLVDNQSPNRVGSLGRDTGRFTEEEFLKRFGGRSRATY